MPGCEPKHGLKLYGILFNYTTVGQASDLIMALAKCFNLLNVALCLSLAGPSVDKLDVLALANCE